VDNLCHTLVGAALSEAGLKKKTALGAATLLIGANLPDVDVLAYFWGSDEALGFRRGWTHGVLALALWPFVLTGLMLAWDRWVRRRRRPEAEPARAGALLLLSAIGILTHPFLDYLNNYGMRWLMPFRDVWFYGDTLFIVDPWIWLALAVGTFWTRARLRLRRTRPERPARWALAAVCLYIAVMAGLGLAARGQAEAGLRSSGTPPDRLMAGPVALTPLRRQVVAEVGETYAVGDVDFRRTPTFEARPERIPANTGHPAVAAAAATRQGAIFLHWARFPYFVVEEKEDRYVVRMGDARYTLVPGQGFGGLTVEVPRERLALPPTSSP
jgi:inner membrane protein